MKITNHILPIMLTLMMLCGVTIAQAVERSAEGFNLVPSPMAGSVIASR